MKNKKKNLKLSKLEMKAIKGGTDDGSSEARPISCWFCGCQGESWKQSWASGKTYHSAS